MKKINKIKLNPLSRGEQSKINGGMTIDELLNYLWNSTPDGGNSYWTQVADGSWMGTYNGCNGVLDSNGNWSGWF
ncbi:MAG: hypothetical protein LBS69_05895 [Prevotellaceae bacterium]|nr:hypothetical protein [Prevotellaceae bacterium]